MKTIHRQRRLIEPEEASDDELASFSCTSHAHSSKWAWHTAKISRRHPGQENSLMHGGIVIKMRNGQ